jgi:hypothetical protein
MLLKDQINSEITNATGFDVPELCGKVTPTRDEILEALRSQKRWHEDHLQDIMSAIDKVIEKHFTFEERYP